MPKKWHLEVILTDPHGTAFTLTRSDHSVKKIWTELIDVATDMIEASEQLKDDQSVDAIETLKLMLTPNTEPQ
jgi:hypothetical protein